MVISVLISGNYGSGHFKGSLRNEKLIKNWGGLGYVAPGVLEIHSDFENG